MRLKSLELSGFKSFAKRTPLVFESAVTSVVGPNGSGKSNVVEAIRFVLGEQSMKSMRGRAGSDLIFKGSKLLPKMSRASVSITFDNRERIFKIERADAKPINLDFEDVMLTREVYADGANKYSINGIEVRLKDILELLSSVNIGSSGHHIISQGEADRILSASVRDRREMIEDALGLKIYQYRLKDSERKLEKTATNIKEVQSLRREIAPHITFLKKQVEKLEKAKEMREQLNGLYQEYLKREEIFIQKEKKSLKEEKGTLQKELAEISGKIGELEEQTKNENGGLKSKLYEIDGNIYKLRTAKDELYRKIGRLEGMIEFEKRRIEKKNIKQEVVREDSVRLPKDDLESFLDELEKFASQSMENISVDTVSGIFAGIKNTVAQFRAKYSVAHHADGSASADGYGETSEASEIDALEISKIEIDTKISDLDSEMNKLAEQAREIRKEIENESVNERQKDKERVDLSIQRNDVASKINIIDVKEESLHRIETDFENELKEAATLIGPHIISYKVFQLSDEIDESRVEQESRRKVIERIKIKLEDIGGGGGGDIYQEYNEVTERDQFLVKELADLSTSMESLKALIGELKEKLDVEFKTGIEKINKQFQDFFHLMFGGGSAFLSIVVQQKRRKKMTEEEEMELEEPDIAEEDEIPEKGIDINISLPHKKVKELQMLSGGERSLTSIALLFAISQVNPPPFLVLDETDAALDESNSRKYGDMIERLSKYSQLIVVTHNRETMTRAGVLYGVTIGSDGGSKLLSIKLEEAVQIAK